MNGGSGTIFSRRSLEIECWPRMMTVQVRSYYSIILGQQVQPES